MRGAWFPSMVQDAAYGFRVFRRRPAIFVSAVAMLGLTVGASLSLVLLIDRLFLKPLPIRHSDRLVQVLRPAAPGGFPEESFPGALIGQLRDATNPFGTLLTVGYPSEDFLSLASDGFQPEPVRTQSVDAAAFATLGIFPFLGRIFEAADEEAGAAPVAVLSEDYWQRRFLKAPDVIGRSFRWRDKTYRIVGVLKRGFAEFDAGSSPDVWFPMPKDQGGRILVALRANAQPRQLESALVPAFELYLQQTPANQPRQGNARYLARNLAVAGASTGMAGSSIRTRFATPLAAVAIAAVVLLLIGAGNVGLLLLALQLRRQDEIAVRVSLGASRGRLVRQLIGETSILALTGCVLGAGLAPLITRKLVDLASDPDKPIRIEWQWDWRFVAAVFLFCLVSTVLCAAAPALRPTWQNPIQFIHGHVSSAVSSRLGTRPEELLIAGQAALALTLLVGAGLLQTSWHHLHGLNPGFDQERLLIAELQWAQEGSRAYTNAAYRALLEKVAQQPGVAGVSISGWSYFGNNTRRASIVTAAHPDAGENPLCEFLSVGPGFFQTMGVQLIGGRGFTASDTEASPLVAVLNESAERQYFGSAGGLGNRFSLFDPKQKIEIVGIVADTRLNSVRDAAPAMVYLPFLQSELRGTSDMPAALEIRLLPGGRVATEGLQQVIRATASGLAARRVRPQSTLVERSLVRERLLSVISAALGLIAMVLAGLGLAGAIAQSAASRRKEFGIRLALGASSRVLLTKGLGRALLPVAVGVAIGAPLSLGAARLLRSILFDVDPFDPFVLSSAILLFMAVAISAASVPLSATTRIDPASALREE
jgi:putative ABC transport system permease protein